jgi:hypothetical protein
MRNAICLAATEDFMVSRQAVTPSHWFSAQRRARRSRVPDVAPAGETAEEVRPKRKGNSLYEHHHGHDERAEARA